MSNELEDFLKRAAQRRAENIAVRNEQQRQTRPHQRPTPEYTSARRERTPTVLEDDDEIIVAEVVPSSLADQHLRSSIPSHAEALASHHIPVLAEVVQAAPTRQGSFDIGTVNQTREQVFSDSRDQSSTPAVSADHSAAAALIDMLRSPQGIRQAFLMRTIFDRPVDRW